jgi:hypothetical protein
VVYWSKLVLRLDDDWQRDVEQNLEMMIAEAEEIAGYENVPEKFMDVHSWMKKLAPETRLLSENRPLAKVIT